MFGRLVYCYQYRTDEEDEDARAAEIKSAPVSEEGWYPAHVTKVGESAVVVVFCDGDVQSIYDGAVLRRSRDDMTKVRFAFMCALC